MLKTVILSPYCKEASGTIEQRTENNALHIKINLNYENSCKDDILRLYALSTSHAAMAPYLADSFSGDFADFIETTIYETDIFSKGYKLSEIDTYVITKYSNHEEIAIASAFFGLEWSASRFLKCQNENNDTAIQSHNPLIRAKEILDHRKPVSKKDESDIYTKEFTANCLKGEKITLHGAENYDWYKIKQNTNISSLSGVKHALSNKYAVMAINDSGYYVAGINKNDCHHIAVGISSGRNICPMPQLSDCCSYVDGYHVAGIYLGPDGQYFEKHLQNSK